MEGCQRCDGNRMDLRQGKGSGEEVAWDGLCQRSISDLISNIPLVPLLILLFHSSPFIPLQFLLYPVF